MMKEKTMQKRAIETRTRLMMSANTLIAASGYEALRIEDVVQQAGVAKGTFFAHFQDKETLMDLLIGEKINQYLGQLEEAAIPKNVMQIVEKMMPLIEFMASERYVFDVILRRSGAAACEEIGVIATTFGRRGNMMKHWLSTHALRQDVAIDILVEGIEAFLMQTLALNFCALHNEWSLKERFYNYLQAWLMPQQ